MSVSRKLSEIDAKIKYHQNQLNIFELKRKSLEKIFEQYPDIKLERGVFISTKDIKDKVSCMSIDYKYKEIVARFTLSTVKTNGLRIYSNPYENVIATVNYKNGLRSSSGYYSNSSRVLKIFNYENFVDAKNPRRRNFIKRIKMYLVGFIANTKSEISDDSFNKEIFSNLLLLK